MTQDKDPTFRLPPAVADELIAAGVARPAIETKAFDPGVVLVVLYVTSSAIQLVQGPAAVRTVAAAIARWRREQPAEPERPFQSG